jgi:TPR repeat protein
MTIKQLAFEAQQHLQAKTGIAFKRSHIYELLAAAYGFNSYASLCADHVFTQGSITSHPAQHGESVGRRYLELDYPPETALQLAQVLPDYLTEQDIGVIRITDLVAHLRYETSGMYSLNDDEFNDDESDDDFEDGADGTLAPWVDDEFIASPILLEGLTAAAEKGNADAHYALALLHAPSDGSYDEPSAGREYWYQEERNGRVLAGVEKEWADEYAAMLNRSNKYEHHLRAAGELGHEAALLEMAERFGDPAFFERMTSFSLDVDANRAADVAAQLGRSNDASRWRTEAARQGDTEAMRDLIEGDDRSNPQQCWTWFYLTKLLGTDLSKSEYEAINEDGSPYDDDVGGPAYVDGRGGVELEPIDSEQEAAARRAATDLYDAIKASHVA